VSVLYTVGAYFLHFVLGDDVSARRALLTSIPPTILFNVLLTVPVYAAVRRFLRTGEGGVSVLA
jgi:hypothetical protein